MNRTVAIFAAAAALVVLAILATPGPKPEDVPPPKRDIPHAPTYLPHASPQAANAHDGVLNLQAKMASAYAANAGASNYLTLEVKADEGPRGERLPANLAVVIDRSGSMSGQKLDDAKQAARHLVELLSPTDRLAIVHYGSDVRTLESRLATPNARQEMRGFIDAIVSDGSTNLSGGLEAAANAVAPFTKQFRATRIILLSDGQPTEGITDRTQLAMVVRRIHDRSMTVTALGVGTDYDELLMTELARAGGGFTGFIADASRLAEVFSRELDQATRMVARDVELSFETQAGVKVEEVLGRNLYWENGAMRVRLGDFSGGHSTRVVVRLSVDLPEGDQPVALGKVGLSYQDLARDQRVTSKVALGAKITADPALALSHGDKEVLEHAARAEYARQLQLAAAHVRKGNREEGLRLIDLGLDNIRKSFGASANALAGEANEVRATIHQPGASQSLQKKSLSNFGDSLDVY